MLDLHCRVGCFLSCCVGVSHCGGLSCSGVQTLGCVGFSSCSIWALEHRFNSCATQAYSQACGIFLDQGSNLCLLYCQADSLPLSHQGSPVYSFLFINRVAKLFCFSVFGKFTPHLPTKSLVGPCKHLNLKHNI